MKNAELTLLMGAIALSATVTVQGAAAIPPGWGGDPTLIAENTLPPYSLSLIGELDLGAYTREVRVVRNTAVVGADHQVAIIDVSNPTTPLLKGRVATALPEAPFGICLVSNLAYVVEAGSSGNSFDTGFLQVVDFTISAQPQVVGTLGLAGGAFALAVSNQKAYVARRNWLSPSRLTGRLEVIDVSHPAQPRLISGVELSGDPTGIQLAGRYAYVAQELYSVDSGAWVGGYLDIVDVADDRNPFSAGQMAFEKPLWGMDVSGRRLVLGGNRWIGGQFDSEITFLDLVQPTQPQILRTMHWETFVGPIRFSGQLMWLSEQLAGRLSVLDSDSETLTSLASCSVGSGVLIFFDVQGTRAYAANHVRGLQIFQLTGPPANYPPVADGSATPSPAISRNGANATVTLNGSRSSDPDDDLLQYAWFSTLDSRPSTLLASGVVAVVVLPVGEHALALVVSDGLAASTNIVTVAVLTTAQGTQRLISLVDGASLPHPRPLLATLEAALASIQRGHVIPAANQLRAFQNQVRAQVSASDRALADTLIRAAQQVMDALDTDSSRTVEKSRSETSGKAGWQGPIHTRSFVRGPSTGR